MSEKRNSPKKEFKMISTTTYNTPSISHNMSQLYYVDESDDLAYNEKRSAHNALERQRREGLNNKFQELAHVLPSLRQVTRPSKSLIVAKSLEFVSNAGERETDFQLQIQALKKENEQLMRQAQLSKKRKKKANHQPTTQMCPLMNQSMMSPPSETDQVTTTLIRRTSETQSKKSPISKKKRSKDQEEEDKNDRPPKKNLPQSIPPNNNMMLQPNTNNLNDQLLLSAQYQNLDMYVNSIPATSTPITHNQQQSTNPSPLNLFDSFFNDAEDLFEWH